MKKKIAAVVILWAVCGFFAWGITLGEFNGEFPPVPCQENRGIAGATALAGPIGLLASLFQSNFIYHGMRWRCEGRGEAKHE